MNKDQIISTLAQYKEKLSAILDRFSKTRDRIHIDIQDGYRFREIVIELVDFINDHIPNSKHHSTMIANYYNEGISNWLGSSSYASVEQVKGVVNAVITRIERNPSLFESASGEITVDDVEEKRSGGIETITSRFHSVVMQMRHRYKNRPTLDVHDEYDVQDFFHSLDQKNGLQVTQAGHQELTFFFPQRYLHLWK
jgi:hypothetical protein